MKYCKKCLTPTTRPRIVFDSEGVCNACNYAEKEKKILIDWKSRGVEFDELVKAHKRKDGYWDCVVPWSGGKDSTANALHLKEEHGMNPLLITFNALMPTEVGEYNRQIMREYGFDQIQINVNNKVSRMLSRRFFIERGNPKVHWDAGKECPIVRTAANFKIPLVIYSEHGETEYGGNKIKKDSDKYRDYEEVIENLIGDDPRNWTSKDISMADLNPYIYPELAELEKINLKAIYMGYFFKWDQWANYEYVKNFIPFQDDPHGRVVGSFTNHDSLDDKIDDLYYYMQYVKFGFGRCVRDASRFIQNGHLTREEGLALCKKYDGEFPARYFDDILKYLSLTEKEFTEIVDKHRNKEIWQKNSKNEWELRYPLV